MFTKNAKKGNELIATDESLPVLNNFASVNEAKNNAVVLVTATQRTTFENLTNKLADLDCPGEPGSTSKFDEIPLDNCDNLRTKALNNIPTDKINLAPKVVGNNVELQLSEPFRKSDQVKSFNLEIGIKENRLASFPLKANNRVSVNIGLNYAGETTSHQNGKVPIEPVQSATKSNLTKRKRNEDVAGQQGDKATFGINTQKCEDGFPDDDNKLPILTAENKTVISANEKKKSSRKRARIMSLYERRYQAENNRSGQQSGISNGYLNSTRSSTVSGSILPDANADQYYMPGTSSATAASNALTNGGTPNHTPTMATLCNIGNTCYLNSVVYTLRFAPRFVHNLHHLIVDLSNIQQNIGKHRASKSSSLGRNINGAQIENARSWSSKDLASFENYNTTSLAGGGNSTSQGETQKSSQQQLTEKLHELYQNLHCNEVAESVEPYHADILLHAIQEVSSIFEGNQQQDAHEFLMCVLNSIRETCQTLIKAIADCPDVILNGCMPSSDQIEPRNTTNKDARSQSGSQAASSSLSTTGNTKTSFFMRMSKRKDESKSSKNQRLQSPLKENAQPQSVSNSLFYINTVDLSTAAKQPEQLQPHSGVPHSKCATVNSLSTTGDDVDSLTPLNYKERLAEKIRQLGLDFFREDFEGVTVSTTKCLSCETITEQKEIMIDIAVPVPASGLDNTDYTDKSTSFIQNSCITREYFRGENKYRCEQCTGYTEAIRSISYEVLPRLLVIQLSRFSGGMEKINSYIPTSFTLQCFCSKCCELSDGNKLHVYKLYSVITHVGATMSVGHYIAYTCCLDWANEYINCPKDLRRNQQFGSANALQSNIGLTTSSAINVTSSTPSSQSSSASALASSGTSLMKKMKFGRNKASSSGDLSKNVKNLNGVTSKIITNGIGQMSMNATCQSVRCCASRFGVNEAVEGSLSQLPTANSATNCSSGSSNSTGALYMSNNSDVIDENFINTSNQHSSNNSSNFTYTTSGYGSTGRGKTINSSSSPSSNASNEPIWYMCDDDKIKAMTQREFEELLSPLRKITITPYLLFYARIDLQEAAAVSTLPKQAWEASEASVHQRDKV